MSATADREPLIRFTNIHKHFGDKYVHRGIDLTIYQGEILTLMGDSGSGKSVLLRSLIGLDRPDQGEILFRDENVASISEEDFIDVRKKIAYVFQYGALFDSYTVEENLAYPLKEHTKMTPAEIHDKVLATLDRLGLKGNENLFPSELSGGMARRFLDRINR